MSGHSQISGSLLLMVLYSFDFSSCYPNAQANYTYWYNAGQEHLEVKLKQIMQKYPAKNVIFFLGDGMGPVPATAGRIYVGQKQKKSSEQDPLSWETFPYSGLSKTYDVDAHTTDSAASATSFLQGTKSRIWTLGVQPNVHEYDCEAGMKYPNPGTIAGWAQDQGKWAGLITTTRVTHATPGGLFAHSASREWECDADLPKNSPCIDIARQLVEFNPGKHFRVIMGGGREKWTPTTWKDPEPDYNNEFPHPTYGTDWEKENGKEETWSPNLVQYGQRKDGRNLINTWLQGDGRREYVWNRTAFEALDIQDTDYLLGLFERSHIDYKLVQDAQNRTDDPTLDQMTAKGIQVLQKNPKGYFLLVEGGRIDEALHVNNAHQALEELLWFDKSVAVAKAMTSMEDTLIIVTADHSHAVSMVGYPSRNLSILAPFKDEGLTDNLDTSILVWANGPSANYHPNGTRRRDISKLNNDGVWFEQPAFMPRGIDTHGGEDVGVWASGPYSHLFSGTMDNNYIAHAMAFALCAGPSRQKCLDALAKTSTTESPVTPSISPVSSAMLRPLLIAVVILSTFSLLLLLLLLVVSYKLLMISSRKSRKRKKEEVPLDYEMTGVSMNPEGKERKKKHRSRSRSRSRSKSRRSSIGSRISSRKSSRRNSVSIA